MWAVYVFSLVGNLRSSGDWDFPAAHTYTRCLTGGEGGRGKGGRGEGGGVIGSFGVHGVVQGGCLRTWVVASQVGSHFWGTSLLGPRLSFFPSFFLFFFFFHLLLFSFICLYPFRIASCGDIYNENEKLCKVTVWEQKNTFIYQGILSPILPPPLRTHTRFSLFFLFFLFFFFSSFCPPLPLLHLILISYYYRILKVHWITLLSTYFPIWCLVEFF